jgi:Mrp family chromosome partitioning ATPase
MVHRTNVPGVSFVHSGTQVSNAAELIARRGGEILAEARELADIVLLDTAPLLIVSDASELLPEVDAVIMVARAGRTTRDGARRCFELLDRAAIPVLGVVLIGASSPMSYYGTYGQEAGGWRNWVHRLQQGGRRQVVSVRPERTLPSPLTPTRTNGKPTMATNGHPVTPADVPGDLGSGTSESVATEQ